MVPYFQGRGVDEMGCALLYTIVASISKGNEKEYCICDGGFQMNIQELETEKRKNLSVKMFILNDRVFGKISKT